ncbi:uncharacterized protein LOC127808948 isoform X6 [Diospyros lotus]|uniref:uncharacterized protein LOC127808948 isoform X6 n=1 Tax=Diospyros lotus TaxID=55363 RepID=UPI002254D17E|nr:uncharacterized protein LOC127808948 isoform X6 [Diospyros lotus]
MSVISNIWASPHRELSSVSAEINATKSRLFGTGPPFGINWVNLSAASLKVSTPSGGRVSQVSPLRLNHSRRVGTGLKARMTVVDERLEHGRDLIKPSDVLAYDLVQGAHVRWSYIMDRSVPNPPTAVLLHGILGSRKNWGTFARRLSKEFPTWQLEQLRLSPRVIVGHSFGGKVALSMVDQVAKPLARPVRVWVLDATPGKVRAGRDGEDHPAELISFLSTIPKEVASKRDVVDALVQEGFSKDVAQWVVTNLRQSSTSGSSPSCFSWMFDLHGIAEMYHSYEETNLWKIVEDVPRGVHVNFLKAERSLHRWALEDLQRIHSAEEVAVDGGGGVEMHVLEDAGHWVHADNPDGLFRILSFSFQGV